LRLTASDGALSAFDDMVVTVQSGLPELIFADGFESGNLSAWSSTVTDGGDLSVSVQAALSGTFGLSALLDDNNPIYVTDDSPAAESIYTARFAFDPNSIAIKNGNDHVIFRAVNASDAVVLELELRATGRGYSVRLGAATDSTTVTRSGWTPIDDAPTSIELNWRASTAPGANNGTVVLKLNGTAAATLAGIDNDTRRIERTYLGAVSGIDNGTRGTSFFDGFEARRT
jgi:hypothetical protein